MFKLNKMSSAVLVCMTTTAAFAQQQLERVEVTGSHILSANSVSPSPIQVMTSADIASSGVTNLADLLATNPVFGSPTLNRSNSNFLTTAAGTQTVNLRNLGDARTLVLVNGRRFVSGSPGSSAVDFNMIPTDFIDRIEILTGGASSMYGSDAVAGVVNVILKKDFQGLNLNAKYGRSYKGDDVEKTVSATFGVNAPDNKGNLMTHISVTRQGEVRSANRDESAIDNQSLGTLDGIGSDLFKTRQPFFSSYAPSGRFVYSDAANKKHTVTIDANGNPVPFSTNGPNNDGVGATGFNRSAYRYIAVPVNRLLLSTKGDYNIAESQQVFFEATYANSRSVSHIEPLPLDSSTVFQATGGQVPLGFQVNGQQVFNPYAPSWMLNGDPNQTFSFRRRMADLGPRTYTLDSDTYRVLGGLKGDLTKTWSYETYAGYGVNKQAQLGTGQVNIVNFANALQVIPGPNGPQCLDPNAVAQGCVPANIFGANRLDPAAAAYISAPVTFNARTTQKLAGASINGEPFDLPAGPVGVALGWEWRQEYSSQLWDQLTLLGLNGGNATPDTVGKFQVNEFFAETHLPLLKSLPLVKTLDGVLAYRHGDYSTVGTTNSWNAGLDWAVNNTVRVRATQSLSTRAPNIGELYTGPSQTFPSVIDPCLGVMAGATDAKSVNCLADPGVAANVAANKSFTLTQSDIQGVSGFVSGNPRLKAEEGHSFTLGTVITPKDIPLLKNTTFSVDYYNINITHAINTVDQQYVLNQCYVHGIPSYCAFITRYGSNTSAASPGALRFVNTGGVNSGGTRAKGVDLTAAYSDIVGPGRLNAQLSYTHLINFYTIPQDGANKEPLTGNFGAAANRWNLDLGYQLGSWGVTGKLNYIGESHVDQTWLESNGFTLADGKVGAQVYLDGQVTYKWGKAQFYVGGDNLLNRKAPAIPSGVQGNTTGTNTAADVYDAIGRRYYVGMRYSF